MKFYRVGPLYEMTDEPEEGALLMFHFADGSQREVVRLGSHFRSRGEEVEPVKWQLLFRVGTVGEVYETKGDPEDQGYSRPPQ